MYMVCRLNIPPVIDNIKLWCVLLSVKGGKRGSVAAVTADTDAKKKPGSSSYILLHCAKTKTPVHVVLFRLIPE